MKLKKPYNTKILKLKLFLFALLSLTIVLYINIPIWQARAAATIIWDGGGNGTAWSDPLNWNTNVVPVPTDDVLIETVHTVTITEPITINSLTLGKSTISTASVLNFGYDAITGGALTLTGGDLIIYPGAYITHTVASGNTVVGTTNINIQNGSADIRGSINVEGKGYTATYGPGAGESGTEGAGGAAHAGYGGDGRTRVGSEVTYGSYNQPITLGSGGGYYSSGYPTTGGPGGGAIKLTVTGTTTVSGTITANGLPGAHFSHEGGGGAGGSVWITTGTLAGTGNISAKGGVSYNWDRDGGGGGGGRVAVYYTSNTLSADKLSAEGGRPDGDDPAVQKGGAGTVFTKSPGETYGILIIDNKNSYGDIFTKIERTPIGNSVQVDELTISNYSRALSVDTISTDHINILNNGIFYNQNSTTTTLNTFSWDGGAIVDNGGTFSVVSGGGDLIISPTSSFYSNVPRSFTNITVNGLLSHSTNYSSKTYAIDLTVSGNFTVSDTGSINVNGKGYAYAQGPGAGESGTEGAGGAAHAGYGGNGRTRAGSEIAYGSYSQPVTLGSGGGDYWDGYYHAGGYGGGAVKLTVTGTTTVDGNIYANGMPGVSRSHQGGGGAGGSVWITTGTFAGIGNITANGGTSPNWDRDGGGGGGGRIAVYYTTSSFSVDKLRAEGGIPQGDDVPIQKGGAGTIFTKATSQTYGTLTIDNEALYRDVFSYMEQTPIANGIQLDTLTIANYSKAFPVDTITTNHVNVLSNGVFYNLADTTTTNSTITWNGGVILDNGGNFTALSGGGELNISAASSLYANVPRSFTNVTVDGLLTHNENYNSKINAIDFTVSGNFTLNATGSINVNGKGYAYGQGPGAGGGGSEGAGGAAHAGYGGDGRERTGSEIAYGSYSQPITLGSGGGDYWDGYYHSGGYGGGAIKLTVTGTTTVDGNIYANGVAGPSRPHQGGGGAGGSIWITTGTLAGLGNITADGGTSPNWDRDGGGGGGGRIAVYYTTSTYNTDRITAQGGTPQGDDHPRIQKGGAGTIFTKATSQTYGSLTIDNETLYDNVFSRMERTPIGSGVQLDILTVSNYARALSVDTVNTNHINVLSNGIFYNQNVTTTTISTITWDGGSIIDNGGTFSVVSGGGNLTIPAASSLYANVPRSFTNVVVDGTLTHTENYSSKTNAIDLTVSGNFTLNATGSINVNGKGYAYSQGPGAGENGTEGAGGAAHAGYGGNGRTRAGSEIAYGSYSQPITLGSGGGDYYDYWYHSGGYGGGSIKLTVTGTSTINGNIYANGMPGFNRTHEGGGGAGGSVWITTDTFAGIGNITANGGSSPNNDRDGGGGGGGRIAIHYTTSSFDMEKLRAEGGIPQGDDRPIQKGGAGTIFTKAASQTYGSLLIDNKANFTTDRTPLSRERTFLENGIVLDSLTVTNYSLVYPVTSVTTDQFNLLSNGTYYSQNGIPTTYNTFTWNGGVLVDNGGTFNAVSGGGDLTIPATSTLYSNVPRSFTNVTVNGTLSHTENYSSELNKLIYTVSGNFTVNVSGTVNVTGKGYAYGQGPGAGQGSTEGGGGAAHGGAGGNGQTRLGSLITYGSPTEPVNLGSGGGNWYDAWVNNGGYGGGAIRLIVGGTTTVNGNINASGASGYHYPHEGGGGAGGSIWITTGTLAGTANIIANGGNGLDWDRDGGGGGGGRIAVYYEANTFNLNNIFVNGGAKAPSSQVGLPGSITTIGLPSDPLNLRQFKLDGTTAIGEGSPTNESSMIVKFSVKDGDTTETLTPEVEIQPIGTAFNDIATHTGTPLIYSGTTLTAEVTLDGLADNATYHWQARSCDSTGFCSDWISFGSNTEDQPDVRITMNADPSIPVIPDGSFYINGQYTNYLRPTLGFVLSDPNNTDTVGFRIQVDNNSDFLTPVVDYTSAMGAQGTQLFTVGQAAGEGTYNDEIGSEGQELVTDGYYWRVKAIDDKGSESDWTQAPGTPAFQIDLSAPTNATNVRMKAHSEALNEYTESPDTIWFNRNDLYFEWDAGTDVQGVKGYCLYLGQDPAGDPAEIPNGNKGVLGTSPVSITGTTCQFITSETSIDFSNTAYRNYEWLFSSNTEFYFKVKTIDIANNVFVGPDETNFISFNFDNTPPQNVSAISSPSSTYSRTLDMYFQWPTTVEQGASDEHSQVLGFQYALNTRDVWYGESTDTTTGYKYTVMDRQQPFYLPEAIRSLVQLGQNTLYFRVADRAGNFSELRTAVINYGGEAPKFLEGEEVTVTPNQSDTNSFAFSWPEALPSEGNTVETYYYMINTPPPVSYATITSNSAAYIPTTETSVPAGMVPGLRKGSNTIYVVAVDEVHNYSSANVISKVFYLNTDLPGSPEDIIIADSSIKDVSIWRAALIWSEPEYMGTGSLTYHVQRSEDGENWQTVTETTGLAHIDTVEESKQYYWRIGASDNSDESKQNPTFSNAVTLTPRGKYTVPATLTSGPAASFITTTRATISWTTNRTADSKVAIGLAGNNYFEWEPSISTHNTEHKIPLSNLNPGTTYYYKAKWTDEDGNTGISDEKTFTTEPPPEVKEVRISNRGVSSAIINFTSINASKAKIYYGTTTSFGGMKEIGTSKLETSYSVELDNLEDGTKYYYRINTFDAEDAEYDGTILDFETLPRPRVYDIKVQQVAKTAQSTLLVSWYSNTEVSSIVTFNPESNPELVKDSVDIEMVKGEHKMLIKGLFPDTVYQITVRGRDLIGNEAVSQTIRVTTATDTRPPLISGMGVEGANVPQAEGAAQSTASQLIVTWTTDEPATSQIEYAEGSGTVYTQLTQEDKNLSYNHVVIISGLTPSKVYHLRAISTDIAGNVSHSVDTVTITPKATNNAFYLVLTTLQEAFGFLSNL